MYRLLFALVAVSLLVRPALASEPAAAETPAVKVASVDGATLAQEPVKEVKGTSGAPVDTTREQYKMCLESEAKIKALRKGLEEDIARNKAQLAEVAKRSTSLQEQRKKLLEAKDSKVGPFNRLSEEHNKLVQAARKNVEKLKAQWATFNTTVTEHNKSCSTIIITAEDRDEVMKARSTVAGR
ncbi:hypothetical protein [Geomonas edaphica]|uniref:hypothetical protein n=1 Tax=Geomonas edaphica TaxID=2570226 RepID=UPI0010A8F9A6|nr:hypothetical protein [Geomonas edaphica]